MKVVGEVIWYNPTPKEKENIKTYIDYVEKLYIIDNSSTKNTVPIKNKKIEYIFNNENAGISVPINKVAKRALKDGASWLLTMDQDTVMNTLFFGEFENIINNNDCSLIGIITPWHKTKLETKKTFSKYDYPTDVMTSGNMVNLKILEELGFYDERFFIDGIDIEYGLRLCKYGYSILRVNDIEIDHNLGNIKCHSLFWQKIICTNHNYLRQYYMARNYRYIKKDYEDIFPSYCAKLVKNKKNILTIILFEKDKIRKIRYIKKGINDFEKNIYGKLEEIK